MGMVNLTLDRAKYHKITFLDSDARTDKDLRDWRVGMPILYPLTWIKLNRHIGDNGRWINMSQQWEW